MLGRGGKYGGNRQLGVRVPQICAGPRRCSGPRNYHIDYAAKCVIVKYMPSNRRLTIGISVGVEPYEYLEGRN